MPTRGFNSARLLWESNGHAVSGLMTKLSCDSAYFPEPPNETHENGSRVRGTRGVPSQQNLAARLDEIRELTFFSGRPKCLGHTAPFSASDY